MALFKDTAKIQEYIKANISTKVASILPFVKDAQDKYLRPYLGKTLLNDLDTWYNDETPETNTAFTELLPYVQNALAKFAFYLATPTLDIQITESGMAVIQNSNLVPASKDRVNAFSASVLQMGYDNIETLLRFLEENKDDYDEWTASDAYTINTNLFINSADEFNNHVNIERSRLTYMRLQQTIRNVEVLIIEPAISKTMCDDIKAEIISGTISAKYTAILSDIRRAVANYTISEADIDVSNLPNNKKEKYKLLGEAFLVSVRKILDAAPTTYTLYAASDAYDAELTDYQKYENTDESSLYVFGGG